MEAGGQLNFAVVGINREVHREENAVAFESDGIHFSSTVIANIGWHLAGKAAGFLGADPGCWRRRHRN